MASRILLIAIDVVRRICAQDTESLAPHTAE
ncbi:hypothetical protein AGR13a_Lc110260 [Agrobacterium genomosp. 13 str. CFBP 6927]|uniref:Transposase n=1 Tax=Agrobacterium genomosp. 13 str. CFBP 6927 TaxID=1183428 RepID=A0ABP2BNK9_9HYPH|nr:hypothetical protein AGR13a_Lc110260 [Agrobacterium genomosp. 13 str. CFBP 6927]